VPTVKRSIEKEIDDRLLRAFDMAQVRLALGDSCLNSALSKENESLVFEVACNFGLLAPRGNQIRTGKPKKRYPWGREMSRERTT
jgi:hypothetical protein